MSYGRFGDAHWSLLTLTCTAISLGLKGMEIVYDEIFRSSPLCQKEVWENCSAPNHAATFMFFTFVIVLNFSPGLP